MVHVFNMKTRPSIANRVANRAAPWTRAMIVCGTVALIGACESEPESHVVSAPPPPQPSVVVAASPVVVTSQTTTTTPAGQTVTTQTQPVNTVFVSQAPPAFQAEVVVARPSSDYLWVPGYWTWKDNRYEWMAGHWEIPPHSNSVWVAPHWEPEAGGYRFYEGYWY